MYICFLLVSRENLCKYNKKPFYSSVFRGNIFSLLILALINTAEAISCQLLFILVSSDNQCLSWSDSFTLVFFYPNSDSPNAYLNFIYWNLWEVLILPWCLVWVAGSTHPSSDKHPNSYIFYFKNITYGELEKNILWGISTLKTFSYPTETHTHICTHTKLRNKSTSS